MPNGYGQSGGIIRVKGITHQLISTKTDDPDTSLIRPSDWNVVHTGGPNLWKMSLSGTSTTLTNNSPTQVLFDTSDIDGGDSVIDLANDRFVAPSWGYYILFILWQWETTAPGLATIDARVNGTGTSTLGKVSAATNVGFGALHLVHPMLLNANDLVTVFINPGTVTGVTWRGSASATIRSSAALLKIL